MNPIVKQLIQQIESSETRRLWMEEGILYT
ncbi:unnamed protein product [Spirodela intermedia]|uniref:Uncharacterized protein n=2 Tax=Spirodela intermedia TaxID=51605 RepID=A0A7I8IYZ6_SPIIN|nr:unnamed protein product [Spirodela intermedia]CAA6662803.1 unnamed protein product [Spirodela intermedia]CAA7399216.1 unnamed protein product [Spirodela intermedia]